MVIAPNIKLDALKNKFKKFSNLKYTLIKLVLYKTESNSLGWYIYYGHITLLKEKLKIENKILYEDKNIIIAEFATDRGEVDYFINDIEGKQIYSIMGFFEKYKICSSVDYIDEYFLQTEESRNVGLDFPCEEVRLKYSESDINQIKLLRYRSVNELVEEKLNINLNKYNGLQYALSFYFEIGLGKIDIVDYKYNPTTTSGTGQELRINLEFNKLEKKDYALRLFSDKYSPKNEGEIKDLDLEKEIVCPLKFEPNRIELRLIYKDVLVDKYIKILEIKEKEELNNPLKLFNINYYKDKALDIKSKIKIPEGIEFGVLVEQRLNEAEQKINLDPKDSLQALGEGMEYLCGDYCKIVNLNKADKVGLALHTKIFQHWRDTTDIPITKILYQPGVRHIIKMGALKKHGGYKPNYFEIAYLIELAWRGYYEIIRMIKEVQDVRFKVERRNLSGV